MLTWEDIEDQVTTKIEWRELPATGVDHVLGRKPKREVVYFKLAYKVPNTDGIVSSGYAAGSSYSRSEEEHEREVLQHQQRLLNKIPSSLAIAIVKTLKEEGRWTPSYAQPGNNCYNLLDTTTGITWSVKTENCYQGWDNRVYLHYSIRDPKGLDEKDQDFVGEQLLAFYNKVKADKAGVEYNRSRAHLISAYEGK